MMIVYFQSFSSWGDEENELRLGSGGTSRDLSCCKTEPRVKSSEEYPVA